MYARDSTKLRATYDLLFQLANAWNMTTTWHIALYIGREEHGNESLDMLRAS